MDNGFFYYGIVFILLVCAISLIAKLIFECEKGYNTAEKKGTDFCNGWVFYSHSFILHRTCFDGFNTKGLIALILATAFGTASFLMLIKAR